MKYLIIGLFIIMYLPTVKAEFVTTEANYTINKDTSSDEDGDGFGTDEDCDDTNNTIHPDAEELCDGIDNNCEMRIDEGCDTDGDGFDIESDCDDNNNTIYPGAEELCDGIDNNCDNNIDETGCVSDDIDGDGILDSEDNCVYIPNANQLDSDNDNIGDVCDNCINVSNEDQKNTDGGLTYISTLIENREYDFPFDVEIDINNNLYICDSFNKTILKFDSEYNKLFEIEVELPGFIDIDSNQDVYILSNYSKKVMKYTSNGEFISEFGLTDNLMQIRNIAVNNDFIYILTTLFIRKYNFNGELIISYPVECETPVGFDVDTNNNIYVSDVSENKIIKYDSNGNILFVIGERGSQTGQIISPFDVKTDKDNNIYVADSSNKRIQKFNSDGIFTEQFIFETPQEYSLLFFAFKNDLSEAVISFDNNLQVYSVGDNLGDVCDNCVDIPNRNQYDGNNNQIGDVCEGIIVYECSLQYPNGICQTGYECVDGNCVEISNNECSINNPEGICQTGYECIDGNCVEISNNECSINNPEGICQTGYECVDGNCVIINGNNNNSSDSDDGCSFSGMADMRIRPYSNIFMLFIMMIGLYIKRKS